MTIQDPSVDTCLETQFDSEHLEAVHETRRHPTVQYRLVNALGAPVRIRAVLEPALRTGNIRFRADRVEWDLIVPDGAWEPTDD